MERHIELPNLAPFVREFTEEHRTKPVTLEVLVGSTWNIQERGMPLMGVDLETKGPHAPIVEILLGDAVSGEHRHLTHAVHRVTGVTVELDENEEERRLIVEDEDGSRAVLSIDSQGGGRWL